MLAEWARRQWQKEDREKGRAEERRLWLEWRAEVEAWVQRKADADREGREFTEPLPASPSGG